MLKTSGRVDRLLRAHAQREQEFTEGTRKPPTLPDLKPATFLLAIFGRTISLLCVVA